MDVGDSFPRNSLLHFRSKLILQFFKMFWTPSLGPTEQYVKEAQPDVCIFVDTNIGLLISQWYSITKTNSWLWRKKVSAQENFVRCIVIFETLLCCFSMFTVLHSETFFLQSSFWVWATPKHIDVFFANYFLLISESLILVPVYTHTVRGPFGILNREVLKV